MILKSITNRLKLYLPAAIKAMRSDGMSLTAKALEGQVKRLLRAYTDLLTEMGAETQEEAMQWVLNHQRPTGPWSDLTATVVWAREEFADKEHVARCRGDKALADYYQTCKDHLDRALNASRGIR